MTKRTVTWISFGKGFGIIAPDGGAKDAFVHIGAVERSAVGDLREPPQPGFEVVTGHEHDEPPAENVKLLN